MTDHDAWLETGEPAAWEKPLRILVFLHALFLPVSIALGQLPAYPLALIGLGLMVAGRLRPKRGTPFLRFILLFLAAVAAASALGVRPVHSLLKMDRFVLLALIPVMAVVIRTPDDLRGVVRWLVIGITLKAAYDLVRFPVEINLGSSLFEAGNMRDPQFYSAGLLLLLGMVGGRRWSLRYPPVTVALILMGLALLLHFKRGAWISFFGAVILMSVLLRSRKPFVAVCLVFLLGLTLSPVRERIGMISQEFTGEFGGRYELWTQAAPVLIAGHPQGMGWKAMTYEDLLPLCEYVQPGLNHLHNNILQILAETGWAGAVIWVLWMGWVLILAYRLARRATGDDPDLQAIGVGVFGAFSALLINGLVEYNFGDSEIFMLMNLLMGMLAASIIMMRRVSEPAPH